MEIFLKYSADIPVSLDRQPKGHHLKNPEFYYVVEYP